MESEKFTLEDGRKAEKVVKEVLISNQEKEIVTELKAEEERPLKTQTRVTEKVRPFVYERKIETLDPNTGEVIDVTVEEVIKTTTEEDRKNCLTKEEMIDTIVQAIKNLNFKQEEQVNTNENKKTLKSLGVIQKLEESDQKEYSTKEIVLIVVIVLQVLGLAYLLL